MFSPQHFLLLILVLLSFSSVHGLDSRLIEKRLDGEVMKFPMHTFILQVLGDRTSYAIDWTIPIELNYVCVNKLAETKITKLASDFSTFTFIVAGCRTGAPRPHGLCRKEDCLEGKTGRFSFDYIRYPYPYTHLSITALYSPRFYDMSTSLIQDISTDEIFKLAMQQKMDQSNHYFCSMNDKNSLLFLDIVKGGKAASTYMVNGCIVDQPAETSKCNCKRTSSYLANVNNENRITSVSPVQSKILDSIINKKSLGHEKVTGFLCTTNQFLTRSSRCFSNAYENYKNGANFETYVFEGCRSKLNGFKNGECSASCTTPETMTLTVVLDVNTYERSFYSLDLGEKVLTGCSSESYRD